MPKKKIGPEIVQNQDVEGPEEYWIPLQKDQKLCMGMYKFLGSYIDEITEKGKQALNIPHELNELKLQIYIFKNIEDCIYGEDHKGRLLSAMVRSPRHKPLFEYMRDNSYDIIFLFELIKPKRVINRKWRFILKPTHTHKISQDRIIKKYRIKKWEEIEIAKKMSDLEVGPTYFDCVKPTKIGPLIIEEYLDPKDWSKFMFVMYETKRIKHEKEWKLLFRQSGVSSNTEIVVLSGVPALRKKAKKL